jgi:outer membrane receptor protein involved in Fe transport
VSKVQFPSRRLGRCIGRRPARRNPEVRVRATIRTIVLILSVALSSGAMAAAAFAQTPPRGGATVTPAAGPGRIHGVVQNATGERLASVGVTLRAAADSVLVTGVLTGRDGSFRMDGLAPGRYLVRVALIGYLPRSSEAIELTVAAPTVDLGTIVLEVSAVEVDALEATVDRPAVVIEADRTVYDARQMPVAEAGNATDVLRSVPELEVDVNNNVRLRGNQAVAVHLNGRPTPLRGEQLANFLQQLPGNRIARVEVLPNPSARHDPEGMGGIVNIVLRDDADLGLSGSVTLSASTRNRQSVNGRLNYQRGRLTLFTGGGVNTFANVSSTYNLRQNLAAQPITLLEQNTLADNRSRGWHGDWTAEFRVGQQATLWSNAYLYASGNDTRGTSEYGIMDAGRVLHDRYDRRNIGEHGWSSYNIDFGFKQVFERQREELTVDGRVTRGANITEARNTRLFHLVGGEPVALPDELTLNDVDTGNGNLSMQADYFRQVAGGRLDVGYRAWRRDQDSDNVLRIFATPGAVEPRGETRSGYVYEEMFHSLYTTWARTVGRFGMTAGLRAERSATEFASRVMDDTFERDYNTLFPSLTLSFSPRQGRTARFLYAKRISRPPPFYLDPFVPTADPLNVFTGNPALRPTYTQSFTVDYSHSGSVGTVRVAPYYRSSTDVWERIRTVDEAGVATSRWENAASSRVVGSTFTVSLRQAGRLSGSSTFSVYRDARDGTNISAAYRRAATLWSVGGNVGLRVSETTNAQGFVNHFPMQSILQGRASGWTMMSFGVRQRVSGTRGTISLNVMDPFNMNRSSSTSSDPTFIQHSRSTNSMRMASLGFTYNFGRPPQRQGRQGQSAEAAGETIRIP